MPPIHKSPCSGYRNLGHFGKKLVRDSSIPALLGDHIDLVSAERDVRISTSSLCSSVLSLSNSLIVPLTSESVPNVSFKALVDSGSTNCFIESTFVWTHNLTPFQIPNIPLKLFDGTTNSIISEAIELPIRFTSGETLVLRFLLTSLDKTCMVVLRHNWLTWYNPTIDWVLGQISFRTNPNKPLNPRYPLAQCATATNASILTPPKYPHEFAPPPILFVNAAAFSLLCKRSDTWTYHLDISAQSTSEGTDKPPIPKVYSDFTDVFSKAKANLLAPHRPYDLKIVTPDGVVPPHGRMYLLSETETKALWEFLDEHLALGFICPSQSPHGVPVLFVKKQDGSLQLCIDFQGLNKITQKDRYPLLLISDLLDAPWKACIYTKIDLQHAYHLVRIAEYDEWKTTFRTRLLQLCVTRNSELQSKPQTHPIGPYLRSASISEALPMPPICMTLPYYVSEPRTQPLPHYIFPFTFPFQALLHITLLVIPCPPISDARLFHLTHLQDSWTSIHPHWTFLIRSQCLPDLESPLFSFCTDFELYK